MILKVGENHNKKTILALKKIVKFMQTTPTNYDIMLKVCYFLNGNNVTISTNKK